MWSAFKILDPAVHFLRQFKKTGSEDADYSSRLFEWLCVSFEYHQFTLPLTRGLRLRQSLTSRKKSSIQHKQIKPVVLQRTTTKFKENYVILIVVEGKINQK